MEILDTAGLEEFRMVKEPRMKDRDAFIVVFDLNNEETLDKIDKIYEQIYSHHNQKDVPVIMVGNKLDKERVVSQIGGEKKAIMFNSPYIECSALTGENIEDVFHLVIRELRKRKMSLKREGVLGFEDQKPCCCEIF